MLHKIIKVVFNLIRFIKMPCYTNLLAVELSTKINKSRTSRLVIGKKFRSRYNVEINVRDRASLIIGDNVFLNSGCIIASRNKIIIGDNSIFGPNVLIYDNDHLIEHGHISDNQYTTEPIVIGKNVWIGGGSIILKGSVIEDNCVIAAGSVINGNIKKNSILIQKRINSCYPIKGGKVTKDNEQEN